MRLLVERGERRELRFEVRGLDSLCLGRCMLGSVAKVSVLGSRVGIGALIVDVGFGWENSSGGW